jgi:DNA polymerase-3 subunit alpha
LAWVIRITEVDPIPFGLLFERFLNPARISMPDFDIDFEDTLREKVIEYVRDKY